MSRPVLRRLWLREFFSRVNNKSKTVLRSWSRHFQGGAGTDIFVGRSRLCKEAPAASSLQAKKEKHVLVS